MAMMTSVIQFLVYWSRCFASVLSVLSLHSCNSEIANAGKELEMIHSFPLANIEQRALNALM